VEGFCLESDAWTGATGPALAVQTVCYLGHWQPVTGVLRRLVHILHETVAISFAITILYVYV